MAALLTLLCALLLNGLLALLLVLLLGGLAGLVSSGRGILLGARHSAQADNIRGAPGGHILLRDQTLRSIVARATTTEAPFGSRDRALRDFGLCGGGGCCGALLSLLLVRGTTYGSLWLGPWVWLHSPNQEEGHNVRGRTLLVMVLVLLVLVVVLVVLPVALQLVRVAGRRTNLVVCFRGCLPARAGRGRRTNLVVCFQGFLPARAAAGPLEAVPPGGDLWGGGPPQAQNLEFCPLATLPSAATANCEHNEPCDKCEPLNQNLEFHTSACQLLHGGGEDADKLEGA